MMCFCDIETHIGSIGKLLRKGSDGVMDMKKEVNYVNKINYKKMSRKLVSIVFSKIPLSVGFFILPTPLIGHTLHKS
jgi:hypothetical protein